MSVSTLRAKKLYTTNMQDQSLELWNQNMKKVLSVLSIGIIIEICNEFVRTTTSKGGDTWGVFSR